MSARRARLFALAGVLLAAGAVGAPGAFAQTPSLGGWDIRTAAAPISITYNSPSTGIPASPTAEMHIARTIAENDTGFGYSLASVAWPGPTAANALPLASQEIKGQVREGFEDGDAPEEFLALIDAVPNFPRYEVRSESFYPQGPDEDRSGVEGIGMRTTSREARSEGFSSMSGTTIAGIIDTGSASSSSRSFVEGGLAVSEARATVQNLSLLGGIITAKQISTVVTATSDGAAATLGGSLTFTGLRVADQDVTLDENGFRVFGEDGGISPDRINQIGASLKDRGIEIIVSRAVDSKQGANASRSIDGVLVVFKAGALRPFVDELPEQLRDGLSQVIEIDQVVVLAFGAGHASAAAAPVFTFELPAVLPPVAPGAVVAPGPPPAAPGTPQAPAGQAAAAPFISTTPVAAVAVPAGLGILVGLLGLLGPFGLGPIADRATTMRSELDCPQGDK